MYIREDCWELKQKKNPGDLLEIAYFRHNVDCTTFFLPT